MSNVAKIFWAAVVALAAVIGIASQFIEVRERSVGLTSHTTNSGELTRDVLVGQTFVSNRDNLSAIGVMFATYSGRNNTEPVEFRLRSRVDSNTDIRTATVDPRTLGDNQLHRFEFEPIADSKGKEYFFFVTSINSVPGNAVAVDLDTRDPYHLGSAYVVRGQGPAVTDPEVLSLSGKQTIDVVFETYHSVPLRVATVNRITGGVTTLINTWDEKQALYTIWAKALIPALLFLATLGMVQPRPYQYATRLLGKGGFTVTMLLLLLAAGIGFRVMYAVELPVTNDEGNYLYDARTLREGNLAGGDGYVKAPLVVAWIALWQMLLGDTVLAGRMSSIVIGGLTMIPLYFLAKDLWSSRAVTKPWLPDFGPQGAAARRNLKGWGRRAGIVAAAIWACFGAAIVFNIYIHTQAVALFFGVSALAVLLSALRGTTPRLTFLTTSQIPSAAGWFFFAGVLLGLGVASRKSILALGLVPLLFILLEGKDWKKRWQHILLTGAGFLLVIAAFLGLAWYTYGTVGVSEALGINSAEDGISAVDPDEADQVRAYSLRGMTPFFRESLPLILLSLIGLGIAWEQMFRAFFRHFSPLLTATRGRQFLFDHIMPKLGWLVSWAVFIWAWSFFFEYEGSAFMRYGIRELWFVFALLLVLYTLLPRRPEEKIEPAVSDESKPAVSPSLQPGLRSTSTETEEIVEREEERLSLRRHMVAALLPLLWVGGLVIFYTNWIKFHANYISEFIPPLTIIASYGAVALYQRSRLGVFFQKDYPIIELFRRVSMVIVTILLLWAIGVSNYITYLFEHTGTFHQGAVVEAAAWAKENIPLEEPIFTGAAVVPYVSGHHTALDIAHPRWYAYEFTRKDTERLNTFLPPQEEMLAAYRGANWFLLDQQTGFSFLMEYSEIEGGLERDWEAVKGIENGGNTLTFYRRIK